MAIETVPRPATPRAVASGFRRLGAVGILGAPMLLVEGLARSAAHVTEAQSPPWVGALGLLYLAGWASSAFGMYRLRVAGDPPWAAMTLAVQVTWLMLAASWAVLVLIGRAPDRDGLLFAITDIAWPLSHLFMLVAGVLIVRARVWRGWRTLPPFLCGLALPGFLALQSLGLRAAGVFLFGTLTALGFAALGVSIRTTHPAP